VSSIWIENPNATRSSSENLSLAIYLHAVSRTFTSLIIHIVEYSRITYDSMYYNGIYRLSPEGEIQLLERNQTRPNGLVFSPDEETLYVANSDAENKVWYAYTVIHGIIGNPRIFYDVNDQTGEGAADGMKVDSQGNIFATGPGGVWIFDPDGTHLGTIKPDEVPANVAWGDNGSTLYMTARTGLYRVRLSTSGEIP
jgi:gluconolactonase